MAGLAYDGRPREPTIPKGQPMFEQAYRNIDDVCRKEAGCTAEQDSWLLFLKYLDGREQDRAEEVMQERERYSRIREKPYRGEEWGLSVKNPDGGEVVQPRSPEEILDEIEALDAGSAKVLKKIRRLL